MVTLAILCYVVYDNNQYQSSGGLLLYQRVSTFSKFTFTVIKRIRQVFVRSARNEIGRGFLPLKGTFVVNANGDFAAHVGEDIEKVFQQTNCKLNTSNNSSWIN